MPSVGDTALGGGSAWELAGLEGAASVRMMLHARIDTTQIYASIRPPQLKQAVSFYEATATKMLSPARM